MGNLQVGKVWEELDERSTGADGPLAAARAGDRAAQHRLLAAHQRSLLALCRDMLGRTEDAEDAVQETFLRALQGLDRFRAEAGVRTWLFQIAIHLCLDWKRARRPVEPLPDEPRLALRPEFWQPGPEADTLRKLRIGEALRSLLPRQRAVLLLKEWQGFSVAEIAVVMNWKIRRVHNELYAARRALADWLRREEREGAEG